MNTEIATPSAALGRRVLSSFFSLCMIATISIGGLIGFSSGTASAVDDDDWLTIVNTYRAMSGVAPLTSTDAWIPGARAHSCYMLQNTIAHDEIPGNPGYTAEGDLAGNSGNVAVSGSTSANARSHIDLWMTGPFHAIGILRHSLATTAYGECEDENSPRWRSGATLDVIRGIDANRARPTSPIVFPGNGSTVPLYRFITESPNPMTMCGWTGNAGLPLFAMMPNAVSNASATLSGPNGPVDTCVLNSGNTGGNATGDAILAADNAVIVMPRDVLVDGEYSVSVNSNGGMAQWSFTVDKNAPLTATAPELPSTSPTITPTPDSAGDVGTTRFSPMTPFRLVDSRDSLGAVRLDARRVTRIRVADASVAAVSANFVAVDPNDNGYLTVYNCTTQVPKVSLIGYGAGEVIANQSIIPLDDGDLCLYSIRDTDVVIDVNGYYNSEAGAGFVPVVPKRLFNTADADTAALRPNVERSLQIGGLSAPDGIVAAALNVTAVNPSGPGFVKVYPCGANASANISTINYVAHDVRPNSVVSPVSADGRICFSTLTDSDLIIDFTGYFVEEGGLDFAPLDPLRLFDSRSPYVELNATTGGSLVGANQVVRIPIAGQRGVPADARAVSINLTAAGAKSGTFLTAYPCGTRPDASNVNITPSQPATANGAMVQLSSDGDLCIYTKAAVHIIVDINGVWL